MLEFVDRSEEPDEWLRDKTLGNAFETNLTSVGLARLIRKLSSYPKNIDMQIP